MELEAFLREPLTSAEIDSLGMLIAEIEGVESATFISKEDAAKVFKEEFGEDITTVLDFNPLPPSFRIALKPGYKNARTTQRVTDRVSSLGSVESVVYRKALIELLDRRTDQANTVTLALGIIITVSAILHVSNTIRLAIPARLSGGRACSDIESIVRLGSGSGERGGARNPVWRWRCIYRRRRGKHVESTVLIAQS